MAMVRKQIFITEQQARQLKRRAMAEKRPVGELIRAAIDRDLMDLRADDGWKERIKSTFGALKDNTALDAAIAETRDGVNRRFDETRRKMRADK